jgi:hypothetical protein
MDPHRFDTLARSLTRCGSHRGVLGFLLGAPLGLLTLSDCVARKKKR